MHLVTEDLDDLLGLSLAEEAVVDVDRDELLSDSLEEKGRHDGAVHTAGQGQQDLVAADLGAERLDLLINESLREGGRCDSFHIIRSSVVDHGYLPFWACKVVFSVGPF